MRDQLRIVDGTVFGCFPLLQFTHSHRILGSAPFVKPQKVLATSCSMLPLASYKTIVANGVVGRAFDIASPKPPDQASMRLSCPG